MTVKPASTAPPSARRPPDPSTPWLEHAPSPMAAVESAMHIVRYVNPAFCRLVDKAEDELVGKPFREILPEQDECLAVLDRVYRGGRSASHTGPERSDPGTSFSSYAMWPVMADRRAVGVMIQVTETAPLHAKARAMNEALLLGSLRQHELAAAAGSSNIQLQKEIGERKQRELDAMTLTSEVSHRIKNNLQIVATLIAHEAKRTSPSCVQGYEAMQTRIAAIAELYDLISQSGRGETVPLDEYLKEIAKTMSASLLGSTSDVKIEVTAEALDIDSDRAVPFGLLVNELATNAVKHAFPGGIGRVVLNVEQIGDQIELTVADNGSGMKDKDAAKADEKHGTNYVAMFVRQLGGTLAVSGSEGTGTIVKVRLPSLSRRSLQ